MIGRTQETKKLLQLYGRNKADFVAIYGRRRVGKTYLVDEVLKDKITFHHAGLSPVENRKKGAMEAQLKHFWYSLQRYGIECEHCPSDWMEAFFVLEKWLQEKDDVSKQVVFLDELPWMDTPRSGFVTALEGFWNTWACHRKNLMLVVCGSANSWILDNLINNHGGLYGRVTCEIKLAPFTLRECEDFLHEKGIHYSRYDIVQSYMIFGGIPFYLDYFENDRSLAQNVDALLFSDQAVLKNEFDRLFSSVFSNPAQMKDIVEFLYTKNAGYTRGEIAKKMGMTSGGVLSARLNALIGSDFVVRYIPFGMKQNEAHYKLTDPFCLFYLHFMNQKQSPSPYFWLQNQNTPTINSWRGFAFENVCFNHIGQIKAALGISGVRSTQSAWSKRSDDLDGTQIDLLINRDDHVINACEIKFYGGEFSVDKGYDRTLRNRMLLLSEYISPKTTIFNTLITTYGLRQNEYSGIFSQVIVLDDLF